MTNNRTLPKISVITVTYNAEETLEETLRSVASQTYPEIEYILIDGGSKDNTLALAGRYRSRIQQLVSEPDRGLYDAMNKGLALATGTYICYLNAGDRFHQENTLQQLIDSVEGEEWPDVLYGETALVDSNGRFLRMRRLSAPEELTWRSFRQGMVVCHQAFFAKRTLAPPYNLRYRFSADFDWCIRILKQARTLHNAHLTLIDYLNEGMTTQNRRASLGERFRIMVEHYGWWSTVRHHAWFLVRLVTKPDRSPSTPPSTEA